MSSKQVLNVRNVVKGKANVALIFAICIDQRNLQPMLFENYSLLCFAELQRMSICLSIRRRNN